MVMYRFACVAFAISASYASAGELADKLRSYDANVFPSDQREEATSMLSKYVRARRDAANVRSTMMWRKVRTKQDWEKFRDAPIGALRKSLGSWQADGYAKSDTVEVTGKIKGDGFVIEKLIIRNPSCVPITANLYRPLEWKKTKDGPPGILICHSHHNPKTQGELQDMGMMWARLGCFILVMDQLGHGERRQHPFVDQESHPKEFRVSRQDYYFRYNVGIHLHLAGESLIGWMVRDLDRGRLFLIRRGVDPKRIILLGAVAGGGDPVAVAGAIGDNAYAAVAPFNFGGPQPENRFPLPKDADLRFNYAGGGSWESTRNLQRSCRDGFVPWVIVGAIAPKGLIYAHEFAWDKEHDPVWKRLEQIYRFYDARDHLSSANGRGSVRGRPPTSTHCNNIGAVHRKQMYPALKKWVDIPIAKMEYSKRLSSSDLQCVTPKTKKLATARARAAAIVDRTNSELASELSKKNGVTSLRDKLQERWEKALGSLEPSKRVAKLASRSKIDGVIVEKYTLADSNNKDSVAEPTIPILLLVPKHATESKLPVVVAIAQSGKSGFLKNRSKHIEQLLEQGVAVCLPDLRGIGETSISGDSRRRRSYTTGISSTALMVGDPMVTQRLRDLRSVCGFLRKHPELDTENLALWGDSFAKVNSSKADLKMPLGIDGLPEQSEPLGGLLAMLGALYEDDVRAVYVRGGVVSFRSILDSPFCYLPHDIVVPGTLTAGDLPLLAAALSSSPVRLEGLVDGALNLRVPLREVKDVYASGLKTGRVSVIQSSSATTFATWLKKNLD